MPLHRQHRSTPRGTPPPGATPADRVLGRTGLRLNAAIPSGGSVGGAAFGLAGDRGTCVGTGHPRSGVAPGATKDWVSAAASHASDCSGDQLRSPTSRRPLRRAQRHDRSVARSTPVPEANAPRPASASATARRSWSRCSPRCRSTAAISRSAVAAPRTISSTSDDASWIRRITAAYRRSRRRGSGSAGVSRHQGRRCSGVDRHPRGRSGRSGREQRAPWCRRRR